MTRYALFDTKTGIQWPNPPEAKDGWPTMTDATLYGLLHIPFREGPYIARPYLPTEGTTP